MNTLVILRLLGIVTILSSAWGALVKGVVRDSAAGTGLSGVRVQVKGTATQTTTDTAGGFSLMVSGSGIQGLPDFMTGGDAGPGPFSIYDIQGKVHTRPGTRLADGVYILKAKSGIAGKMVIAGSRQTETRTGRRNAGALAKAAAAGDTLVFSKSGYLTREQAVAGGDTNLVIKLVAREITHGEQITTGHVGPWTLQNVSEGAEVLDTPPRPSQGYFRLTEWRSQQLIPDQPFVGSDSDLANLNDPANKGGRLAAAAMIDGYLVPAGTYVCQFRDLLSIYCQSITSGDYLFRGCRFRNCGNAFNAAYSSGGFHIYIHYSDFGGDGPNDWQDGGGFLQLVGGSNHRVYRCRFRYIATAIQPNVNGVLVCENYIDKICYYYGDVGRDGIPGNSDSYHLNGVSCEGGLSSLQILRNKILVPSPDGSVAPSIGAPNRTTPQTDCIALFQSLAGPYPGDAATGIQVRDNYLGGSGYVIYGGGGEPGSRNVKITGNKITTRWWTNGGNFGPFAYDPGFGTNGNEKANNTWADDYGTGGNGINPPAARQYPLGNGPRQGKPAF